MNVRLVSGYDRTGRRDNLAVVSVDDSGRAPRPEQFGPTGARSAGACGLCGRYRRLSKTHVPPQAAGNRGLVTRAQLRSFNRSVQLGRREVGGMWVRTLCSGCNSMAGARYDRAYAAFADGVRPYLGPARRLLVDPLGIPGVRIAPGLVARSVLIGMHALNPRLRDLFPQLAEDLLVCSEDLRLPPGLRLRMAATLGPLARLGAAIHSERVLVARTGYFCFAEFFFPPLAWVLAPPGRQEFLDQQQWADATEWPRYGPHAIADLRDVIRSLPIVRHHQHRDGDNWMQLMPEGPTPLLEGTVPGT